MPTVEIYKLITPAGRPIRKATKVTLDDGRSIKFLDRLSKRDAIAQAERLLAEPTEHDLDWLELGTTHSEVL